MSSSTVEYDKSDGRPVAVPVATPVATAIPVDSAGGSAAIATASVYTEQPAHHHPQNASNDNAPLVPVPLSHFRQTPSSSSAPRSTRGRLVRQDDGTYVIDTPIPCFAYLFMLPFPFFCMGCCLFKASYISFDMERQTMTSRVWSGVFQACASERVVPFSAIANVATCSTSTRVNGIAQRTWFIVLRSGELVKTGSMAGIVDTTRRAQEVHQLLFGNAPNYRVPSASEMVMPMPF